MRKKIVVPFKDNDFLKEIERIRAEKEAEDKAKYSRKALSEDFFGYNGWFYSGLLKGKNSISFTKTEALMDYLEITDADKRRISTLKGFPEKMASDVMVEVEGALQIPDEERGLYRFGELARAIRIFDTNRTQRKVEPRYEGWVTSVETGAIPDISISDANLLAASLGYQNGFDAKFYKDGVAAVKSLETQLTIMADAIFAHRYKDAKAFKVPDFSREAVAKESEDIYGAANVVTLSLITELQTSGRTDPLTRQHIDQVLGTFSKLRGKNPPYTLTEFLEEAADIRRANEVAIRPMPAEPLKETIGFGKRLAAILECFDISPIGLNRIDHKINRFFISNLTRGHIKGKINKDVKEGIIAALGFTSEVDFAATGDAALHVAKVRASFVEILKKEKERTGLTSEQIAERSGVKPSNIKNYMSKKPRIAPKTGTNGAPAEVKKTLLESFGISGTVRSALETHEKNPPEDLVFGLGALLRASRSSGLEPEVYARHGVSVNFEHFRIVEAAALKFRMLRGANLDSHSR